MVILADGTYSGDGNRDLDFLGKPITLRSQNGPELCIIDCQGSETEPHRGIHFHSGEDVESMVVGITITNGYEQMGGAIFCEWMGFTLKNCILDNNSATGGGGGMFIYGGSPLIQDCIIRNNVSHNYEGGGIWLRCAYPTFNRCEFVNNISHTCGGGISMQDRSEPIFLNCLFQGNNAMQAGGSMWIWDRSAPILKGCLFTENSARGGADLSITQNEKCVVLENCLLHHNVSESVGGAIAASSSKGGILLTNCTICDNSQLIGAVYANEMTSYDITNCILWGNKIGEEINQNSQIYCVNLPPEYAESRWQYITVNHTCIQGWTGEIGGEENFGDDPLFADPNSGDYRLLPGSSCIDTGINDPAGWIPVTDFLDNPRPLDGNNDGLAITDRGILESWPSSNEDPFILVSRSQVNFYANQNGSAPPRFSPFPSGTEALLR
ncbi:MAG: right-handed parallel beta-helix repeat-containing protein [Sedimentisphaerales bacterium]|nr:right-handed parallel beta-helix repeat-containing protein [Sedimentisphaerales bacterium]